MTEMLPSQDDRATSDAINWVIWLAEEPDDEDLRAKFAAWHAASGKNQHAWRHANKVSGLIGQSQNIVFLNPAAQPIEKSLPHPPAWRRHWPVMLTAAMAACLALFIAPDIILRLQADHHTGTAQQQTVTLKDGSVVRLGPQSAVSVAFANGERRVNLLAGEAYFEVARDERHPFRVFAGDAVTTVLGTGFDVRRDDEGAHVAVRHGRVRVDFPEKPGAMRELIAGQWTALTDGAVTAGQGPASLVGSWGSGQLAAVDRPVNDVISDIRRYYKGLIIVRNRSLAGRSASGSFDMANPVAAVIALVQPHGAAVTQITPWIIVIS